MEHMISRISKYKYWILVAAFVLFGIHSVALLLSGFSPNVVLENGINSLLAAALAFTVTLCVLGAHLANPFMPEKALIYICSLFIVLALIFGVIKFFEDFRPMLQATNIIEPPVFELLWLVSFVMGCLVVKKKASVNENS